MIKQQQVKDYAESIANGTIEIWDDVFPAIDGDNLIDEHINEKCGGGLEDLTKQGREYYRGLAAQSEIYAHNIIGCMMASAG